MRFTARWPLDWVQQGFGSCWCRLLSVEVPEKRLKVLLDSESKYHELNTCFVALFWGSQLSLKSIMRTKQGTFYCLALAVRQLWWRREPWWRNAFKEPYFFCWARHVLKRHMSTTERGKRTSIYHPNWILQKFWPEQIGLSHGTISSSYRFDFSILLNCSFAQRAFRYPMWAQQA